MWDAFVAWLQSPGGARVLQTAIIPALAILVAGLLAAAIARSAVRATIRRAERVEATSAVAGLVAAAGATADAEGDVGAGRRASRLRAEADVRVRLLPLAGADLAADWAAARIDALQRSAAGTGGSELAALRDGLVEWIGKPARAKRIFAAPVPRPASRATPDATQQEAAQPAPAQQPTPEPQPEAAAAPEAPAEPGARAVAAPGPRRTPAAAEAVAERTPEPEPVAAVAAAATPAPAAGDALPAWQRTRTVERLQQERGRTRGVEAPAPDSGETPLSPSPMTVPRPHRADATPPSAPPAQSTPESDEAVRLEAHQQARHARPNEDVAAPTGAVPAAQPTPAPAWLDTYDDEAQVTQNLDLKTPPPVAAAAIRDRGTPGEDLVPRS